MKNERETSCVVYPAFPGKLSEMGKKPCTVTENKAGGTVTLANGFLMAVVSVKGGGVLTAIENRLTGQRFELQGDRLAFSLNAADSGGVEWNSERAKLAKAKGEGIPAEAVVRLEEEVAGNKVTVVYRLRQDWFWVERHLEFETKGGVQAVLDGVVYGNLAVPGGKEQVLSRGRFDKPRLVTVDKGGVFAGLGWWFYTVDKDGVYRNDNAAYPLSGRYVGEPWYVGVFQTEPGDPHPGWAWYKACLHVKKEQTDKQPWWAEWNGGWGQWGLNIEDATTKPYIELTQKLGLKTLLVGGGDYGYGTPRYVELAKTSEPAKANIADLRARGLTWGCLENGKRGAGWADARQMQAAHKLLDECVAHELKAFGFDFFTTTNTYGSHRNVAAYFKACREKLDYTECHLGMAEYGPQFQREVMNNHPTDIEHDSSKFSADWCTFLAFRRSRVNFQRQWNYLSPDYGMFYFLTHYANWGHPRTYQDPEPQQLMYKSPGYCAIGYNFHDLHGFRSTVAAVAAFTPVYIFGHLDLKMPAGDVEFARKYIGWVGENAAVIRRGRVCHEDGNACVVSKIRDGKGAIFLVNYAAGERMFKVKSALGGAPAKVRQVFPVAEPVARELANGAELAVTVRGEGVAILDVNGGFKTLPPSDPTRFPVDVAWGGAKDGAVAGKFAMPDVAAALKKAADPNLPKDILSLEQIGKVAQSDCGEGCGKLSEGFKQAYGMREDKLVETWKLAPWAYGDRIWFVYRPAAEYQADGPCPKLKVNGAEVPLVPRINYHHKLACLLFFADVTAAVRQGGENEVALTGLQESKPGYGGIYCAAERY
ncbi:MAG: hypothetical protein V1809_11025 [Planctomycetota bacterium]